MPRPIQPQCRRFDYYSRVNVDENASSNQLLDLLANFASGVICTNTSVFHSVTIQRQTTVTVYLKSKLVLLIAFAKQTRHHES